MKYEKAEEVSLPRAMELLLAGEVICREWTERNDARLIRSNNGGCQSSIDSGATWNVCASFFITPSMRWFAAREVHEELRGEAGLRKSLDEPGQWEILHDDNPTWTTLVSAYSLRTLMHPNTRWRRAAPKPLSRLEQVIARCPAGYTVKRVGWVVRLEQTRSYGERIEIKTSGIRELVNSPELLRYRADLTEALQEEQSP